MIKVDKGETQIEGDRVELSAELVFLFEGFIKEKIFSKETLKSIIELSDSTTDENYDNFIKNLSKDAKKGK